MLHTKRQTQRACLLLALCVASLYVSSSEARSDPSLFWATVTVTAAPPVAPSEIPTMAPVATSSAPVADLTPTAAPEVTATPVESTTPTVDATPAPTPSLAPSSVPVNGSPTSAPVIDAPAPSVDGGPITTATDPKKDFGPMTGGGTRPISPPSVPAPTPETLETPIPAPAANGTPTPPTESVTPVTDPDPAPVAETEAPTPSGAAIDPEKDFGPMTGGGTRPTSPPVVTPAPTSETSATIAETQAPPADTVAPSTDPVPDSVAEGSAPSEAPTSDEGVVDTGLLPPLETDPVVDISDDGVADGVVENADPEPAIDESVDMAPVIADTEDTLDTSETETEDGQETEIEDGQVEETLAPPAAESSAAEPLPPANTPEPQSSSNFIIRAPASQILPPPQVVTGTASDGSLTSTVIFNGANILTPHS